MLIRIFGIACIAICFALTGCDNHSKLQGYVEGKYTYVASQAGGVLLQLNVKRGDSVQKNQPLFGLELNPQLEQYQQAKAQLAQAAAQLANLQKGKRPTELAAIEAQQQQIKTQWQLAKTTSARYQKLYAKHFITKEMFDQAATNENTLQARYAELVEVLKTAKLEAREDEIRAALAQVTALEAAVKQSAWQLQQKAIIAPLSGLVFDTYYRVGEVVPANYPVLSILAPENIYAVFFVPENLLASLRVKDFVALSCDQCATGIKAQIRFISPEAEYTPPIIYSEKTREKLIYRVEADFLDQSGFQFHPGQPISLSLSEKR